MQIYFLQVSVFIFKETKLDEDTRALSCPEIAKHFEYRKRHAYNEISIVIFS